MNPLQSAIPAQHYTGSINTDQPLVASSSQTQPSHPAVLSLASLSFNARFALDQTEAQPNGHHQLMALLARNGIADGAMHLSSAQGPDAHYEQQVNVLPENNMAQLTVSARLNAQAQYDIAAISLYVPSSRRAESLILSAPPAQYRDNRTTMSADTPSMSSHLAAQYSRRELTHALIRQNSPQDFSGAPLPSGDSVSTQGMVFSQDAAASASTDNPGPGRSSNTHSARSAPYPLPSLASRPGALPKNQPPKRQSATDAQINAHLHDDTGLLRTKKEVTSALHADELGADSARIGAQLKAAGGGVRQGATDVQLSTHLHNDNGSLRTQKEVVSALRANGLGANNTRIWAQLHALGGARNQRSTTDAQINAHLHNDDGSLRSRNGVVSALHANGLGADTKRIGALLNALRKQQ